MVGSIATVTRTDVVVTASLDWSPLSRIGPRARSHRARRGVTARRTS